MGIFDRLRGVSSGRGTPPGPTAEELYLFGRYEFSWRDVDPAGRDAASQIEPRYYSAAVADPELFISQVLATIEARGGWAAYGGMRLVASLLTDHAQHPGYDQVCEVAFAFLRSRNINFSHLAPREIDWWVAHHPGQDFLSPRPGFTWGAPIRPLNPGERRVVANMGPNGNHNDIVVWERDNRFEAIIQSPGQSWESAIEYPWYTGADMTGLYERVGESLKTVPSQCDPELAAFCPLLPPDLSP